MYTVNHFECFQLLDDLQKSHCYAVSEQGNILTCSTIFILKQMFKGLTFPIGVHRVASKSLGLIEQLKMVL